jgi:adenylylsulfate kinase
MIYWFTGQPGAGKTTLAKALKENLEMQNLKDVVHIDGDDIRSIFNNTDYSRAGREKNIQLAQQIAHFLTIKGLDVVVSLVSPYLEQRENFKKLLGSSIQEIYVYTTEIRGREKFHVADYEKPETNFIEIDTTNIPILTSLKAII